MSPSTAAQMMTLRAKLGIFPLKAVSPSTEARLEFRRKKYPILDLEKMVFITVCQTGEGFDLRVTRAYIRVRT